MLISTRKLRINHTACAMYVVSKTDRPLSCALQNTRPGILRLPALLLSYLTGCNAANPMVRLAFGSTMGPTSPTVKSNVHLPTDDCQHTGADFAGEVAIHLVFARLFAR